MTLVFSGRDSLVALERFDEIGEIAEAAVIGDFRDGSIGRRKLVAGFFDAVMIQVFHRFAVRHRRKETAEIFRGHVKRSSARTVSRLP